MMENHNWADIRSSSSAKYIHGELVPMASHAEQYFNPPGVHPSLPNYLWLESGSSLGVKGDHDPADNHQSTRDHLVSQLTAAGISWKTYQEGIDGKSCPLEYQGLYRPSHNPMVYFDDVTDGRDPQSAACIAHMRPFTELRSDLERGTVAQYNFITPDVCHDMHGSIGTGGIGFTFDCLGVFTNLVKKGDEWLKRTIPMIMSSDAYQRGGAIFVVWDESEGSKDQPIGMIVVSPFAKGGGYSNQIHYTHSATLRTFQEIFGVGPLLGDAANSEDLRDLFATFP
jgi:hypothetical protein